ncbi:MAG: HAMP domain-containing histidine kinase [Chitinophagaceae bacterium]|nr:HAMP domain-containing histidine kinase [Oligoflexus sp.]
MRKISIMSHPPFEFRIKWQRFERQVRRVFAFRRKNFAKDSLRYRILQSCTAELLSNSDGMAILKNIVHHLVPEMGDWCLVNLATANGGLSRHSEARSMSLKKSLALDEIRLRFPPNPMAKGGLAEVIRTGKSQLVSVMPDDFFASNSTNSDYRTLWASLGIVSYIGVPIILRGQVYGAIAIDSLTPARHYDHSDQLFLEEIASLMGLALERVKLLREANEANQQKDQFLAMLSHELRTPISAVLGWSQLLLQKPRNPKLDEFKALEVIERSARQQKALVDDILDLSLVTLGRLRLVTSQVDLNQIIQTTLDSAIIQAEDKQIGIVFQRDLDQASIIGDASRLRQVLSNVVNNAIKFTPAGGRINIDLMRSIDEYSIRITDSGIGIDPQFLPVIFDRFRQVNDSISRSYGGMGLGLALVDHIVRLHGGKVWAESKGEGAGTSVVIVLKHLPCPHSTADGLTFEHLNSSL